MALPSSFIVHARSIAPLPTPTHRTSHTPTHTTGGCAKAVLTAPSARRRPRAEDTGVLTLPTIRSETPLLSSSLSCNPLHAHTAVCSRTTSPRLHCGLESCRLHRHQHFIRAHASSSATSAVAPAAFCLFASATGRARRDTSRCLATAASKREYLKRVANLWASS